MRAVTRREVLRGAGTVAGLQLLSPVVMRAGQAFGSGPDPETKTRLRLVVIDMFGGNDGLSTVVPYSGVNRAVYDKVRPTVNIPVSALANRVLGATTGGDVALNPYLTTLWSLWQQQRVAIVQGVDYDNHDYSHFVSDDIWQSGEPGQVPDSGWLGRHLDRTGIGVGEVRGIGVGDDHLPLALAGVTKLGELMNNVYAAQFIDGGGGVAVKRHNAFAGYDGVTDPVSHFYGSTCRDAVNLASETAGITQVFPGGLANGMLTARAMLTADVGAEVILVRTGGFDTHDNQLARHQALMTDLDQGLEAFYYGTKNGAAIVSGGTAGNGLPGPLGTGGTPGTPIGALDPAVAARTLVMTFSEFGRRIGDNAAGTDHGAAAPHFLIGPPTPVPGSGVPTLVPGLHGDHPDMGTFALPKDNLLKTTDLRGIYQAVLTKWINDPAGPSPDEGDPHFQTALGGQVGYDADGSLTGLFGVA